MVAAVCLSLFVKEQVLFFFCFVLFYLLDLEEPGDIDQSVLFERDHGGGLRGIDLFSGVKNMAEVARGINTEFMIYNRIFS